MAVKEPGGQNKLDFLRQHSCEGSFIHGFLQSERLLNCQLILLAEVSCWVWEL